MQQEKVTEGPAMSVSVSVRTPKIKGRRRQRLSPVRELRVMERLPHSERRMQQSSKPKTSVFSGRKQQAGRRCGREWRREFAVGVGSPAGRELGRNSFQPEVGRLLSWSLCRMFLLSGRQGDGQRQRQRAWWVQDAAR